MSITTIEILNNIFKEMYLKQNLKSVIGFRKFESYHSDKPYYVLTLEFLDNSEELNTVVKRALDFNSTILKSRATKIRFTNQQNVKLRFKSNVITGTYKDVINQLADLVTYYDLKILMEYVI